VVRNHLPVGASIWTRQQTQVTAPLQAGRVFGETSWTHTAFRCSRVRGGLACNHRAHSRVHAAVWRRVKPTPLFPELVSEAPLSPHWIPSESVPEGSESARAADSNASMAGWRRSAGRRVMLRITASSATPSGDADWDGQAQLAERPAIAGRTSREPALSGGAQGRSVTAASSRERSTEHSG